jgi:hypothetical protein
MLDQGDFSAWSAAFPKTKKPQPLVEKLRFDAKDGEETQIRGVRPVLDELFTGTD